MQGWLLLKLLTLLVVANGSAVVAKKLLGVASAHPLDGGVLFVDGQPLFGPTKTIRGVVVSVLATSICAALMGLGWNVGTIDRDVCHGWRSFLQLRETQAAPGF